MPDSFIPHVFGFESEEEREKRALALLRNEGVEELGAGFSVEEQAYNAARELEPTPKDVTNPAEDLDGTESDAHATLAITEEVIPERVFPSVVFRGEKIDSFWKKRSIGSFKEPVAARFEIWTQGSKARRTSYFSQMYLTQVNRASREQFQVNTSFDDDFLLLAFGKEVSMINISGFLTSMKNFPGNDMDWLLNMRIFYNDFLRMRKLVESKQIARLVYGNNIIECYPFEFTDVQTGAEDIWAQFSMAAVVRKEGYYNIISSNEGFNLIN